MTERRWFVRRMQRGRLVINPVCREGWLAIAGYTVATLVGLSLLAAGIAWSGGMPPLPLWIAFGAFQAVATAAFVTVAWRTSYRGDDR